MVGYREARRPELQTSVLHRLEEPPAKQRSAVLEAHFAIGRRQRALLAPWRPKVIDAKPSNNSELEQPIASENERTT